MIVYSNYNYNIDDIIVVYSIILLKIKGEKNMEYIKSALTNIESIDFMARYGYAIAFFVLYGIASKLVVGM